MFLSVRGVDYRMREAAVDAALAEAVAAAKKAEKK